MPTPVAGSELLADLGSKAVALGLTIQDDGTGFSGAVKSIRAKWLLGARTVTYRMSCHLDEAGHAVRYREAVVESSWGLPPPTFTVERTTVTGWARSGERTDRSVGGGGTVDYGRVREALKQMATDAGWQFHLEGGRFP
jgi:hypothetical protein